MTEPKARAKMLRELAADLRSGALHPWFYDKDMRFADNCAALAEIVERSVPVKIVVAAPRKARKVAS